MKMKFFTMLLLIAVATSPRGYGSQVRTRYGGWSTGSASRIKTRHGRA